MPAESLQVRPRPSGASRPFLKWAGGKRQLLPDLLQAAPPQIATYYEPFLGGGALFFALAAQRRFKRAVLGDGNLELIICYRAIQSEVGAVIRELKRMRHSEREYYRIRALVPKDLPRAQRAARTIYLNKVGFNGLYRVNSSGKFNVPFGRHKRPVICDEDRLAAASQALGSTEVDLVHRDFARTVADARPDDFVYFDPPYAPVSATAYFTSYAKAPFGEAQQRKLAETLRELGRRKVAALLSNSDCVATRGLYDPELTWEVQVRRAINSIASRRGPVGELLVKSFPYDACLPGAHA